MQLEPNHIRRLHDSLLNVRSESNILLSQFFLSENYDAFYFKYVDLLNFLNVLEVSNSTLKRTILELPKLSSPKSIFDVTAIKGSYLICIMSPIVATFFVILFAPLTVPLLILAIWKTTQTKKKLREIIVASEKLINLLNSNESEQTFTINQVKITD
jgi:hypothetical protein